MRYLFVGGPGRSGTSFVAERLGERQEIACAPDLELKILCEKNGLIDLYHALCETYSPNRAVVALAEFHCMKRTLMRGGFGQRVLTDLASSQAWEDCFASFTDALCRDGHPTAQPPARFFAAARNLLDKIATLATSLKDSDQTIFMEKTPHNLLAMRFLTDLAPGAQYLHVMRDPRSIAWSLTRMDWGPDRLETAAEWVASYCHAWTRAEAWAASRNLPLMRLFIEDAVKTPGATSHTLATWLGIATGRNMMHSDDPEILNRWVHAAEASAHALLDERLGGWVRHFGYQMNEIGQREAGSSVVGAREGDCGPQALPADKTTQSSAHGLNRDADTQQNVHL